MGAKFFRSVCVSLEWRVIAFFITNIFFWFTTHSFWQATSLALFLQAILFISYLGWHFWRHELHMPLFPQPPIFAKHDKRVE
jgi:hypothetical protein